MHTIFIATNMAECERKLQNNRFEMLITSFMLPLIPSEMFQFFCALHIYLLWSCVYHLLSPVKNVFLIKRKKKYLHCHFAALREYVIQT